MRSEEGDSSQVNDHGSSRGLPQRLIDRCAKTPDSEHIDFAVRAHDNGSWLVASLDTEKLLSVGLIAQPIGQRGTLPRHVISRADFRDDETLVSVGDSVLGMLIRRRVQSRQLFGHRDRVAEGIDRDRFVP